MNSRQKCLQALQKLRRIQEADDNGYVKCISCPHDSQKIHWKSSDGGHYIGRANRAMELEPENIWPQCKHCNGPLEGNHMMYRFNLINRIGIERVERLEKMALARDNPDLLLELSPEDREIVTHKMTDAEYNNLNNNLRRKINKLLSEKGIRHC